VPQVTFLPWLGLRRQATIAGITLVPWEQHRSSLVAAERDWLSRCFDRYRRQDGTTPVNTVTVVHSGEGTRARAFLAIRAVAAACLVYEHAGAIARGNPTMVPPRGERWQLFSQRFDPANNFVTLSEGYTANVWALDSFLVVEPLSAGESVGRLDDRVVGMAEALVDAPDEEVAAALDLLVEGAMTSDRHLARLNFVFVGAALELLAGAGGGGPKAARIAEALAEAVTRARAGCPTAETAFDRAATAARRTNPDLVRLWMASCGPCDNGTCQRHGRPFLGFYRRRNKVIHEGQPIGDLQWHQRPDSGELHTWPMPMSRGGAHTCDVALAMSGWLFLDRVGRRLRDEDWYSWCDSLDRASEATGMAASQATT
jgi:hypothetical protein